MKTILIASNNRGKAEEIRKIFIGTDFELKFLFDFPKKFKNFDILENAKSFEGNALIKAIIAGDMVNMITLADDSGLCVDALNGGPGVFSKRYSGTESENAYVNDANNNKKLLQEISDIPMEKRDCHYNCTVAIYDPATKFVDTASGIWEGRIAEKPKGEKSFGYAPIFLAKDFDYLRTNAEFEPDKLIKINHRGKAFYKAIKILENYLARVE